MRKIVLGLALLVALASPAHAQFAFVKASTQGSCASAANCTSSFGTLPTAGNAVAVPIACWNGTAACNATSVTDNQGVGNTYSLTCSTDTAGKSEACVAICPAIGATSGTFTVTVNAAASTAFELIALEYTVPVSPAIVDVTEPGNAAAGTADTGVSASTANADEVSICAMSQSSSDTNINVTTPTGYTRRGVQQNANATIGFEASDKILSATGTQQCAWTHDTVGMGGWAAQLLTLKASAPTSSFGILGRRMQ